MNDNPKIKSSHLQRAAVVYIRQSHPSQMENHPESTARQYALAEKAIALGWNRNQVITIDEDLGISGQVLLARPAALMSRSGRPMLRHVESLKTFAPLSTLTAARTFTTD
jgi:hypothetical protein